LLALVRFDFGQGNQLYFPYSKYEYSISVIGFMSLSRLPLTVEHALLGFLRLRPMHGYELYQQISNPAGLWLVWRLKQSQLYALMTRLEAEGFVTVTLQPQEARPPRKIFQLTAAGHDAFVDWVTSPVAHPRQMRQEFLMKLYFVRQEGPQAVAQLISEQRALCRVWQAEQHTQSDALADEHSFAAIVNHFRTSHVENILTWLDHCEQTFITPFSTRQLAQPQP
jgi:DNA-binding PadR family transcriptional regulator